MSSKIILIKLSIYSLLEFGDFVSKYSVTNPKVQKSGVKTAASLPVNRFYLGLYCTFFLTSFFKISLGHLQTMWKPQSHSFSKMYMLRRVKYLLNKLWFITSRCKTSTKQNQRGTASLYLLQPPHTNSAPASPISIQIIISSPPEQWNIHLKFLSGFACLLTFPVEVNHPCLPN